MARRSRGRGVFVIEFGEIEVAVLTGLLDELELLSAEDGDDEGRSLAGDHHPVLARLYPSAYADFEHAADAAEFSEMTRPSLQRERRNRYAQCRAELPEPAGPLEITPEDTQRWLMVLNDMRLALGTRIGVTAEGFEGEDDDLDDHEYAARAAYQWLTAVQDGLLTTAME